MMTSPILLTGGTGRLGRVVLPLLRDSGATVRVLSRRDHPSRDGVESATGDLTTGEGVEAALTGVETIVHCAGTQRDDAQIAENLVRAAARVGARHLVNVSVVGCDRIPVVSRAD